MTKGGSRNITPKTRQILWARSAGRCQFRNCNELLIGHLAASNRGASKGYVAHIIADSESGPRGDAVLSKALANHPDNVMLLCDACHREIDKENPDEYPADALREMKRTQEEWVRIALSAGAGSRSHILQFSATIGTNRTAISTDECLRAMMPTRSAASFTPIEIKVRGVHFSDSDPDYWRLEVEALRREIEIQQIKRQIEDGKIEHLSVFALAPIPLLMELGRLLSDISAVSVFQLHREPQGQGWTWPNDRSSMDLALTEGAAGRRKVALKLAVSAKIEDVRITSVLGEDVSIWEITCPDPHNDAMRREEDLSIWRCLVRDAMDRIKNTHGRDAVISVFPAIGVACAVEFGRVWQPKAHPLLDIYDQAGSSGFVLRHRIG